VHPLCVTLLLSINAVPITVPTAPDTHRFCRPSIHSCPPLVLRTTPHFDATIASPCGLSPALLICTRPLSGSSITTSPGAATWWGSGDVWTSVVGWLGGQWTRDPSSCLSPSPHLTNHRCCYCVFSLHRSHCCVLLLCFCCAAAGGWPHALDALVRRLAALLQHPLPPTATECWR